MYIRLITILFVFISINSLAQVYIGISCDIGNPVRYEPNIGDTYFKRGLTVSGSLIIFKQEEMRKNWFLRYGLIGGVLGHSVKVELKDTLSEPMNTTPDVFLDYSNLYASLQFGVGKHFYLEERKFSFVLSGGVTRYFNLFSEGVSGSVGIIDDNNVVSNTFYYEMLPDNKFSSFVEATIQVELSRRIEIGLSYKNHFKAALNGSYEFYHTEQTSNGKLFLTQKAFSVLVLVKMGRND